MTFKNSAVRKKLRRVPVAQFDTASRHARLRAHVGSALSQIRDYAVILVDGNGLIAGWNTGAARLLGHSAVDVVGQPLDVLFTAEDRKAGIPKRELDIAALLGES